MKRRGFDITALLLLLMPMLGSCRQELCYDHYPVIDINFAWEREWERDYGEHHLAGWDPEYYGCDYDHLRPGMPEWINMISYYDDGRRNDNYMSPDGRRFIVEAGEQRSALLYNGDTEYIVVSDMASLNEARAEATSRSRASLDYISKKHSDSRTTNPPDILYSAFIEKVPSLANHDLHALEVKMQPLVFTYHITYEFEHGINHVVLARGALGGMAESVYLRTGVTSDETSIILFDCDVRAGGCSAAVRSFGVPGFPDAYYGRSDAKPDDKPYTLNLEVLLRNGKTLEFNYDISDQLRNQPRGGVIKVTGLRIEDEQDQFQSGFQVEVTEWDEPDVITEIPFGNQTGTNKKR